MLSKLGPEAEAGFLRALAAEELQVEPLTPSDYGRWPNSFFNTAVFRWVEPTHL